MKAAVVSSQTGTCWRLWLALRVLALVALEPVVLTPATVYSRRWPNASVIELPVLCSIEAPFTMDAAHRAHCNTACVLHLAVKAKRSTSAPVAEGFLYRKVAARFSTSSWMLLSREWTRASGINKRYHYLWCDRPHV